MCRTTRSEARRTLWKLQEMLRIGSLSRCKRVAQGTCCCVLVCMTGFKGICIRWGQGFKATNVPATHSSFEKAIEGDHVPAGALTEGMQRLRVSLLACSTRTIPAM